MTKRRLKIMRRAYSRPSLKVCSRTVLRSGNIAGTVLFNQVGITLKDATLIEMVREFQPFVYRLGIHNCIYNIICLSELYSMLNTAIKIL